VIDIVDSATRSRMMSGIRYKNTKPEIIIRKALHSRGYRYKLCDSGLPGKPDLVFPKYHAIIFIHGCFWHGHDCHLFKWPKTNSDFWYRKITRNREIDAAAEKKLMAQGWRCALVWECALKGKTRLNLKDVMDKLDDWLKSSSPLLIIESSKG
jgi:DNA mismatch endonuclease (patch repair protein)